MSNPISDRAAGALAYQKAKKNLQHEQRDFCGPDYLPKPGERYVDDAVFTASPVLDVGQFREGQSLPHAGKVLKEIRGMGKVCDWRSSPWTPVNGGTIKPLVFVQHIPVVPNVAGIGDFIRLRDVLVAQGLMVQSATDAEGNVALYTPFDKLCYQARGANQMSCGAEHMHMSLGEAWTKKQIRAAAWLAQLAERKHGIPARKGKLGAGSGLVRVTGRGHVTHMDVSDKAGYHDRSDPGSGFDWVYFFHCVEFFKKHEHFAGA